MYQQHSSGPGQPADRRPGNSRTRAPLLAALLAALLAQGCAGVDSAPWLSIPLTEEYGFGDTGEVRTFEDYLDVERRVFAQLDAEVYVATEADPRQELLRFSSGSLSDPRTLSPNWNRTFELPADQPVGGVLLLHGMSDSPYSLRALGEALNGRGYQVVGLRLPGHGTAPSGLRYARWEDMAAATRLALDHLAARVGDRPIHIIGYSTGAPLALNAALDALDGVTSPVPASLVLVSPAIGIHSAAALAVWKRRLSVLPGLGGLAWLNVEPEFDPYKYNSFATRAAEEVHRLTRAVAARLTSRARTAGLADFPPTLVFKSNADATVTNEAVVGRLLAPLGPGRHELVLFDINRLAARSVLKVADPRALTTRVVGDPSLPFTVTLVTNTDAGSLAVEARRQPPRSATFSSVEPLGMSWPPAVISLSHVALPFPPDDPLYGQRPPDNVQALFLGQMAIQGERGLFVLSSDWLLRMRHNPFYDYLERRTLDWANAAGRAHQADHPH